ncbi:MAG TPA: ATP-binding protein [Candidatus Dormibacteraeota bacterium]|nr:ATP-binding protein [Candidatus Dormibacteraeota bacterium]
MRLGRFNTLTARIALAGALIALVALSLVAGGVLLVGRATFEALMAEHGVAATASYEMFDSSVSRVLLLASAAALTCAVLLAVVVARQIQRPVAEVAHAARSIAGGSYEARVTRPVPRELASMADSFNQMATSLEDQERQRRQLILDFAHELRTPLTNLHGYLQALREGVVDASPVAFASLQEEIDRLMRLSDSLDALVAGGARNDEAVEFDLVPVVRALLELHQPSFQRRGLRVQVDLAPRLLVRADPDALAQVLGNLFQNAGRYTPTGGEVWVRAASDTESVVVSVANSGDAIPAADLPHLFERFYRVEKSRSAGQGGAGIGLAVVKELVEAAGGRVGVESELGLTRFWFRLAAAR